MDGRYSWLCMVLLVPLLMSCGSEVSVGDGGNGSGSAGNSTNRSLKVIGSEAEFFDALKQGLIAQSGSHYETYGAGGIDLAVQESAPDSADSGSSANSSANEVTSTTVQEQGVDEQDWVKVSGDGEHLYVLKSGYSFDTPGIAQVDTVLVDPVDPVGDEAIGSSIPAPQNYLTTLRILALDVDTPDSSSVRELDIDLAGRYAEGFYLYETANAASVYITSTGNNFWNYWSDSTAFAGLDSVITKVDVSDPAQASVTGSLRLDGQLISSRRIGQHLFFASRYYPVVPGEKPWALTADQWRAQVNNTDISTLLPRYSSDAGANTVPLVDTAECFVAQAPDSSAYYSPDIITLGVIDLNSMQLTDSECYLGASETLYASPNAIFLATTQYDYATGPVAEDGRVVDVESGEFPADIFWSDPRVDTDIHQFDIDGGQLVYAGSGSVRGHLGWNPLRKPFRMSEKDGFLRVATFNDQQGGSQSPILITVLKADGTGRLETISTLPNDAEPDAIGKPGEQLYASRFLGDRAFLVTFRQTDPLYIIDLSNPAQPRIEGELEIDGYSDYLQPIGNDYLLGIGRDAYAAGSGVGDGRGSLVQGVKLSLFDISDASEPREIQSMVLGQRGTQAVALDDHRAITIQPASENHPLRVSFGIDIHGITFPSKPNSSAAASEYKSWSYTGMHGFEITTGTDAGISFIGTLVVGTSSNDDYPYYQPFSNDRSVIVNDSLFYIHNTDVFAAPWTSLNNPSPAR